MSYGTPVTCRFGAPSRPGPAPERPKTRPTMTWAEMAYAEGHRGKAPPSMGSTPNRTAERGGRLLAVLAQQGPMSLHALRRASGLGDERRVKEGVEWLIGQGLAEMVDAVERRGGSSVAVHITDAGRARAAE